MRRSALSQFARDRGGNIAIMTAMLMPVMIGVAALVLEFGGGLLTKVRLQRVADLAAYAAATAYSSTSSTTKMSSAANMIAAVNGASSATVTAAVATSPRGDGSNAVKVTVTTRNKLYLAPILGFASELPVTATAYASMSSGTSACIVALSGSGAGVTLSGGTSVSAPKCAIASNVSVAVPCGTSITTKEVDYAGAAPSQPCTGIQGPSGASVTLKKTTTTDPLAGDTSVAAATGRISTVSAVVAPSAPSVTTGKDIDLAYSTTSTQQQAVALGCTATFSSPTWTLTCPAGGTYNFGKLTIGGGISLNFNLTGSSTTTYNFSDKLAITGSTLQFGPGNYNFAKGLNTQGGTTTTFGAGVFKFGRMADTCGDGAYYSICHTGTALTFGGPSTFVFNSGINVAGGSSITFGSGTTNSYDIGAGSSGSSIVAGGGSKTFFADATGASSLFRLSGAFNVTSGGGSCMTLPAAAQHDVNGFFASAGGTTLGAGVYTVNGYIAFGANGGGDVTCNGATVGVKGVDVTLVTSGASTYGSGSCAGKSFCLAAGYGNVSLTAPSSGATAKLVVVGPTSGTTAGATFAEGNATSLSGVMYFPVGPISLSGGASVGAASGQCLQIIGSEVTLSGGTAAASNCISSSKSGGTVALVQ